MPSSPCRPGVAGVLSALLLCAAAASPAPAAETWTLKSPDRRCAITLSLNETGSLTYAVRRRGTVVIPPSPLGLLRDDESFETGLTLCKAEKLETRRESYELLTGPCARVNHTLNHRSLVFRNARGARMIVDLAASNEGVAFRYRFPDPGPLCVVLAERSAFQLPTTARAWLQPYHAAGQFTPAYEDFYFPVAAGEPPPVSRAQPRGWCFPALFEIPSAAAWVLLAESGTDSAYCACHLTNSAPDSLYRIAFPAADETTKGRIFSTGPEPRSTRPWTLPWRVIVIGGSAREIATATLVTDLAPPSRVADASWIRPGRASWSWWSHPDGPNTAGLYNKFTDFAARLGWEYTLFDAGWWTPGLDAIASHAASAGVAPLAWSFAGDFYDPASLRSKLDGFSRAGVRGVKVDFWCSDRQETMAAIHTLLAEAAARRMVVNLHGCTVPRGWQRTWPNFLTAEAVLGTECYFFEPRYPARAASLNTVLPFTRNAVGPMDVTPIACSPKPYSRTTTAAHELASALVFTSGIIHYADTPEFFDSLPPEALRILRDAPARWDESRCLTGEPGRLVVFARRSAATWFIAGLNGTTEVLPVELDLSLFRGFRSGLLIAEGADPLMQIASQPVSPRRGWRHQTPPQGGFILRLDRQ